MIFGVPQAPTERILARSTFTALDSKNLCFKAQEGF
jgi:hypothetical protein